MMGAEGLEGHAALAVKAVQAQGARDFDALRAMCAPDMVLEFPYHPAGPAVHHGVDAFIAAISVLNVFATFAITVERVFATNGADVVVEGRSRGTYRSGRADYVNHYLFVLSFEQGRLIRWREFFNPLEALKQNFGKQPSPESPPDS